MKYYSTNLSDSQWMLLKGILSDNRKRKHSLRDIFNAIFYLLKTGCQWRMLPGCFPKWELVYYYFVKWKNTGDIERTFAWFEIYRRLSKDFEYLTDTSETMIQIAMIKLMLNRIQK